MKSRIKSKKDNLDFEISFCEGVLRKKRDFIPALQLLSDAYTKKGNYKKGLQMDLRLARLRTDDPVVFYNLACDYSLLEDKKRAFDYLIKAFNLGYRDLNFMLRDPDLENLRRDIRFKRFLEKFLKTQFQSKFSRLSSKALL